jgi:hypothetical protein
MKSISRKGARNGSGCFSQILVSLLLIPGGVIFYFFSAAPLAGWLSADHWVEVPCTVTRSQVERHDSSDGGPTYSVDIAYEYEWEGNRFGGDRYDFMGGSSSGRSGKEAVVSQFPVGETRVCFIDPNDPAESVLNREFRPEYLIGVGGLVITLVIVGGILWGLRKKKGKSLSAGKSRLERPDAPRATEETFALKGGNNSLVGMIFITIFAVFWNGIVFTAAWAMLSDFGSSSFALFPLLFMIPFVLVGLGLLLGMVYFFLALFNPRPDVTLTPGYLPLGGTVVLGWSFRGNTSRIQKLTITLRGEEKATYRRGTDTVTDTSCFEKNVLVETTVRTEVRRGEVSFAIPEFTAPSFDGSNNKIRWHIRVDGDIPRWPDVGEDFELTVAPLPGEHSETTPSLAEFRET